MPPYRWMARVSSCLSRLALLHALTAVAAQAQSATEIIRGRVLGPDSLPLTAAEVRVTGLVTRTTQTARTDTRGGYTLVFANAEGEYVVAVRSLGFKSATFRLSRVGLSAVLGADVYLQRLSQLLDRVIVTASQQSGDRTAIGEVGSSALADSLFLADPTKLMDLLLSIPGILGIDDSTFSVLGAASNQNIVTLDGLSVRGGGGLPPDALSSVKIVTSSADPARGGFAGANVAQTLKGGTDILGATARVSSSNRGLVWNDEAWTRPVSRPINHSGTANGPIVKGKLRFNVSWNVEDNTSDWYSLLRPRGALLAQRGISLDSVSMVTSALQGLGVPLSIPSGPQDAHTRQIRATSVLDFTPTATTSLRISHSGNFQNNVGNGGGETSFPTRLSQFGATNHSLGMRATGYLHGLLNELNVGYSYYSDHSNPFTRLPGGTVRVGTDFTDGRTGLSSLTFGGGDGNYYEQSWNGEATNELSWIPRNGNHKLKVGGGLTQRGSNYFYFPESPLLGKYTYLTTADLAANRPASYDRILTNTPRHTNARSSSLWVGEEWKASNAWQWQGGLRFDFAHPSTIPRYNPVVDQTFGVRTDRIPSDVGMSPRIGFSWSSRARRGQGTRGGAATLGGLSASAIQSMSPELVQSLVSMQRASTLPGIGVTGTLGAYRGTVNTNTIAELVESTGLPGTRITLSCVGNAVPIPDWQSMTQGPTTCADSSAGTAFSISKPLVRAFDPGFRAPVSYRGNLGVDGIRVTGKWIVALNTSFAWNANGQSTIDLNLNRTPQFRLAGEADRPVYAPLSAIVPATGSISPAASRISPEFATVSSIVSDLRAYQAQFQASIAPPNPLLNRRVTLGLNYTLSMGRSEARASSRIGTTGDPFVKRWVPNAQPVHTIRFTSGGRVWGFFNFALNTTLYSGIPLTPLVSGDINGDGNTSNDRAFIPNPATTPDADLARELNQLIANASSVARNCLKSQLGQMAGANSCRTPWQARFDISASLTPPSGWNYSDRLSLTFNLANAHGALVRAFGLEETPFGQSPLSTTPNSTLLYVTGFDQATGQFKYRVNQLFGEPTNYGSLRRKFAPTQLYLGLEYAFGGPLINPIARGLGLREPPNRPALTNEQRRAAVAKLKRDPTAALIARSDSLGLSAEQRAQLDALSKEYGARADAALTPLLNWVLRNGSRVMDRDLAQRLSAAQSSLGKLNTEYRGRAQGVLTAEQRALFSDPAPTLKREK